jgi:hypothetical protein
MGGKPPSGSPQDETIGARTNTERIVPQICSPEELIFGVVKLSGNGTKLKPISFKLKLFEVANAKGLLQKFQVAVDKFADFKTDEAVGIGHIAFATLVTSGNNLTGDQVGNGRADGGSSEVFHAFIMAHFGTEVKGVTRPSQVRETALGVLVVLFNLFVVKIVITSGVNLHVLKSDQTVFVKTRT